MPNVPKTPAIVEVEIYEKLYEIPQIGMERYRGIVVRDSLIYEADLTLRPYMPPEEFDVEDYR